MTPIERASLPLAASSSAPLTLGHPLMINIVLFHPIAKFACFDVGNFYLQMSEMGHKEYVHIKYVDFPQEFRE
ncbi:hypothetical protein ACHAWF_011968 [Thalassiosira exigua]